MSEWKETRLKSLLSSPLTYGLNVSAEDDREDWPRYIRITDFDDYNNLKEDTFKSLPLSVAEAALLEEGDLLLARSGATAGKTFLYSKLPYGACYAGYLIRARFNKNIALPKFISYFTKGSLYTNWKERYCIQTTIQNISAERYNQLPIIIPSVKEQQRIVDYLDKKLATIDHRVGVLEKEKDAYARLKKSVINQAVTRGLNPNVPLKDSGIDWIGMIPVHWSLLHLKNCVTINNGKDYKDIETEDGIPVIGSGGQFAYASESMYEGEVIFMGRKGTIDRPLYFNGAFWAVDTMFYAIPFNHCSGKFLYYCATCFPYRKISTATALPSMTQRDLYQLPVALPPLSEQQAIAAYLDEKCAKIDAAIENNSKQIDASKRLKKAVINEAISGKINFEDN